MEWYVPPGYLAIEQAIFRFARALAPSAWEAVASSEQAIWDATILSHKGQEFVSRMKDYLSQHAEAADGMRGRYLSYLAALFDLHSRLMAKDIIAYSFDQQLRFGRIRKEVWDNIGDYEKTAGILALLQTGANRRSGRWLFLFIDDVNGLEKILSKEAKKAEAPSTTRGRDLKQAERILKAIHGQGLPWPSLKVLWSTIQAAPQCANIRRNEVDALRKEIDQSAVRGKGRPKKSPS